MTRKHSGKRKKFDKDSSSEVKEPLCNVVSEGSSDEDMIRLIKQLAVDPFGKVLSVDNAQHMRRFLHRFREVMFTKRFERTSKRRRLEHLPEGDKFTLSIDLFSSNSPSGGKLRRGSSPTSGSVADMSDEAPNGLDPPSDWLLYVIGDHVDKKVIPVSPRFQVEVPEWDGSVDAYVLTGTYISDPNNCKWLGARVWPIEEGDEETIASTIGNGRSNSCNCESPGSSVCIQHHKEEERQRLKSDLGPAFFSWKFDEIGEQVSKTWTLKAQRKLESLLKKSSSSDSDDWFKNACKSFHHKPRKEIISYYFDVYIPRRMALHRTSSLAQINTDDEDEAHDSNLHSRERSGWRTLTIRDPKTVKSRYIRGHPQ